MIYFQVSNTIGFKSVFPALILSLRMSFSTFVAGYDVDMHETDNAYSIQRTWLHYRFVQFLKTACNCWQLLPSVSQFPIFTGFVISICTLFLVGVESERPVSSQFCFLGSC